MKNQISRRDFLLTGATIAGGAALASTGVGRTAQSMANAQGWTPTQTVRMIVPFAPGGGSDVYGRAIAKGLRSDNEDLNIVVENHEGGSGAIGYSFLLSKKGQPNYILASESSAGIILPLVQDVPYSWRSFTPISQSVEDSNMVITAADSPYKSLQDLVKAAKKGKVTVGVTGEYSEDTLTFKLLADSAGVKFQKVVFKSGGEINTALLGHNIDAAGSNPSESIGQIKAGKFRPLAVIREQRFDHGALADVPTAAEQGYDFDVTPTLQYRGIFAASNITDAQRKYWEKATVAWTKTDSYEKYVKTNFLAPTVRVGQDFADFLKHQEETVQSALNAIQNAA
jgi:putative tricarboxylic transport membrane protein